MNIAILGASSQIAKDLVVSFAQSTGYRCTLFVRHAEKLGGAIRQLAYENQYSVLEYSEFNCEHNFDVIMNFVGVGDPTLAKNMGSQIFEITEQYDKLALDYVRKSPSCKYIFLSSGAVYGGNFDQPVANGSAAKININSLKDSDWYAIAKLYAEARHRAMPELCIVDVRVFNYFSHTQDMRARFLITDLVRAIKSNEVFKTSAENIFRDFITPVDFFCLINSIISFEGHVNKAVDCYTKAPIDKFTLLEVLSEKFDMKYEMQDSFVGVNATGAKVNYHSLSKAAADFGYEPKFTSIEGLLSELEKIQGMK